VPGVLFFDDLVGVGVDGGAADVEDVPGLCGQLGDFGDGLLHDGGAAAWGDGHDDDFAGRQGGGLAFAEAQGDGGQALGLEAGCTFGAGGGGGDGVAVLLEPQGKGQAEPACADHGDVAGVHGAKIGVRSS